jgi:hypothetical protein
MLLNCLQVVRVLHINLALIILKHTEKWVILGGTIFILCINKYIPPFTVCLEFIYK